MFEDDEELSLKSIHIFFGSFIIIILYFVWKSTQVREIQNFENIPSFTVRRNSVISNASTATSSTIEENITSSVDEITQNIFNDASESFNNNSSLNSLDEAAGIPTELEDEDLSEEERIIREMDRDLTSTSSSSDYAVRRRRLIASSARDTQQQGTSSTASSSIPASESNENLQIKDDENKISIKLKYLNDEIKIVECFLQETIGNFKKRNFKTELESKLIKLIFNGKLLEDDQKSLSDCGIRNQAVVHCLILQKKNPVNNGTVSNQPVNANRRQNVSNSFIHNVALEWNIVGMILVSLTLLFCWYARLQYSAYFSYGSTIGLILMTTLFIIMIPLFSMVFS